MTSSGPRSPLSDRTWRLRHSLWLLVPILGLGFLTVLAVARIAVRTGDPHLKKVAVAYVPPTVLLWVAFALSDEAFVNVWSDVATGMLLLLWIGGVIHCAAVVNRRYLRWRASHVDRPWYEEHAPGTPDRQAPDTTGRPSTDPFGLEATRDELLGTAGREAAAPPGGAPAPVAEPGSTAAAVDLNSAPESALAQVAGVGPVLAKRIVAERQARGGFSSLHELAEIGVPPHALARLRQQMTLVPKPAPATPARGRVLDL